MNFEPTAIEGVFLVRSDASNDSRGSFARIHARQDFVERGLDQVTEQCSLSHNLRRGTIRGLHYQLPPHAEAKLVCCVAGSVFDAVVDLRRASPTFGRAAWFSLSARVPTMVFVPKGCAHGFQTLEDDTSLLYMISAPYDAASARGIRWNDPALSIPWPLRENLVLSQRDGALPSLSEIPAEF
jgi:dTDP-4-dehydrorhamnose 3,5-epimerase